MKSSILPFCFALILGLGRTTFALAADTDSDVASQARAVFAAKCVACHGPNLAKPRGRFGYVLDLARVANNREMVVPGAPDESELWDLVRHDEMPPADSPTGPLSPTQKKAIHDWIAAGAPPAAAKDKKSGGARSEKSAPVMNEKSALAEKPDKLPTERQESDAETPNASLVQRSLGRLGSFHLLIIHFPIALLIAAAVRELWGFCHREASPSSTVRYCVLLGAAGALAAASLGWLYAESGMGSDMPKVLLLHRWMGIFTATSATLTAAISEWDQRRNLRSNWFRLGLLIATIAVATASHFGGQLVHGEDFPFGG